MSAKPIRVAGVKLRPRWAWSPWYAAETREHYQRLADPLFCITSGTLGYNVEESGKPNYTKRLAELLARQKRALARGDAP